MNRCPVITFPLPSSSAGRRGVMVTMLLLLANASAMAQQAVRAFPANAQRGLMEVTAPPELLMNGKNARLSPGARIRGTNNLLVLSGALTGQRVWVNYVRDPHGLVHEVWLLNETEMQQPPPSARGDAGASSSTQP